MITLACNWKMNPASEKEAATLFTTLKRLAGEHKKVQATVLPPSIYLASLVKKNNRKNITLGIQNMYFEEAGSYTGAISANMVADAGAKTVLVGHSERRRILGSPTNSLTKKPFRLLTTDCR